MELRLLLSRCIKRSRRGLVDWFERLGWLAACFFLFDNEVFLLSFCQSSGVQVSWPRLFIKGYVLLLLLLGIFSSTHTEILQKHIDRSRLLGFSWDGGSGGLSITLRLKDIFCFTICICFLGISSAINLRDGPVFWGLSSWGTCVGVFNRVEQLKCISCNKRIGICADALVVVFVRLGPPSKRLQNALFFFGARTLDWSNTKNNYGKGHNNSPHHKNHWKTHTSTSKKAQRPPRQVKAFERYSRLGSCWEAAEMLAQASCWCATELSQPWLVALRRQIRTVQPLKSKKCKKNTEKLTWSQRKERETKMRKYQFCQYGSMRPRVCGPKPSARRLLF